MKNTIQSILPWFVMVHAILFLAFWLTNRLFYASTNDYLVKMTGARMNYIGIFLAFAGVILGWSIVQVLAEPLHWSFPVSSIPAWLYSILCVLFIALFYGGFWILFRESPVQWIRVGQLLSYFRIFIDPFVFLALAALIGLGLRTLPASQGSLPWAGIFIGVVVTAIAWTLPLVYTPGSVIRGSVPAKPRLIAHRGASMLAPENTLASAKLAARLGVFGLETDIHLTSDGGLILMHDDTFKRTTDISQVFPGRANERVENFSLAEVQKLNAGAWFVQQDPFQTIAEELVLPEQKSLYSQEKIPVLSEELVVVKDQSLVLIFDLKQPPKENPYTSSFFDVCLEQIQRAGIDSQIWFLVDDEQIGKIRSQSPQMVPAIGLNYEKPDPAEVVKTKGYRLVNVEYGIAVNLIRAYQDAGLWVNIYTVDEPWQFSRLWLLGVDSITSSNVGTLEAISQPILAVSFPVYLMIWILIGILGITMEIFLVLVTSLPGIPR